MPHLSELHGAATHLAVISIPAYAVVLMLRRFGPGGCALGGGDLARWPAGRDREGSLRSGV